MVRGMIHTLPELAALLGRGQRLLGLDVGTKTVGMAVSDPNLVVASPIGTLNARSSPRTRASCPGRCAITGSAGW